jgi:uncharacterized protein (TIGR00661 family)
MKILFGVFDWGLGHATRDIPLIDALLKRGNSVDIISTGRALKLLRKHFNDKCKYFDVPSISSPYTKSSLFAFSFVFSIPTMLSTLKNARKLTAEIIGKEKYDKIISDCRYDVYDTPDNSYLINHQLRFKAPFIIQEILEFWLKYAMNKYRYVLVPDYEKNDLSGALSHKMLFFDKSKIKYIGIISNLKKKNVKKDIDYFISLSGPEPQRTILENKILSQINFLKGKIVIAGGNPDAENKKLGKNVKFKSFFTRKEQEDNMNKAKFIITRTGYTTILELAELGIKDALLIPTPGQTEQEYLGNYFEKKRYFHHVHQDKLDLKKDIIKARGFKGFKPAWKTKESVRKFLKIIYSE